jgi:uncharacterized protein (UPF0335 family)
LFRSRQAPHPPSIARPVDKFSSLTNWLFFCVYLYRLIKAKEGAMSDTSIPGGRIRSFVERIEHLDAELQELNEQKKEVFAEAKAEGFDIKILKEIIKMRKEDKDERDERETLLDLYIRAMETEERAVKAA